MSRDSDKPMSAAAAASSSHANSGGVISGLGVFVRWLRDNASPQYLALSGAYAVYYIIQRVQSAQQLRQTQQIQTAALAAGAAGTAGTVDGGSGGGWFGVLDWLWRTKYDNLMRAGMAFVLIVFLAVLPIAERKFREFVERTLGIQPQPQPQPPPSPSPSPASLSQNALLPPPAAGSLFIPPQPSRQALRSPRAASVPPSIREE